MPVLNNATAVYRGAAAVSRIYLGATQVWTPPAFGPLVSDTFDRADSTTSLGTAETGQTWTALAGTWGIHTNRAYTTGTVNHKAAVVDAGVADVTVETDVTLSTVRASAGLAMRCVDANNMLFTRLHRHDTTSVNELDLYKRVGGTYTKVAASAESLVFGQTYRLKVVASGTTVSVYIDGTLRITATVSDLTTATKHGLMLYYASADDDNGSRFDNFTADAA